MSKKYLYYFSEGNDAFGGDKVTMKNTLGGKGAGLAEMTAAGMPVPQGFTITTDACTQYYADGRQINDEITADIFEHLKGLEEITGNDEARYYLNNETAEMAQKLFENKDLRVLFDAAKDATPEDLETTYNMLMALKKKERDNNEF